LPCFLLHFCARSLLCCFLSKGFYSRADIEAVRACLAASPSLPSSSNTLQLPPRRYLLTFQRHLEGRNWTLFSSSSTSVVRASFESGASPIDELRCYHHALALIEYLDENATVATNAGASLVEAVAAARVKADAEWPHFLFALQGSSQSSLSPPLRLPAQLYAQGTIRSSALVVDGSGWDLSRTALGSGSWRYEFMDTRTSLKED